MNEIEGIQSEENRESIMAAEVACVLKRENFSPEEWARLMLEARH